GDPHPARAGQAARGRGGGRAARRLGRRVPRLHQRVEPARGRPLPSAGRQLRSDRAGAVGAAAEQGRMKITDILSDDLDLPALAGQPTRLFLLRVAPEASAGAHLKALARISRLLKDESFRQRLMRATTAADLYRTIREEDDKY